jgi:phage terminase Nu1 subunit (DNA packaging protein)
MKPSAAEAAGESTEQKIARLERELAAAQAQIAMLKNEYICKCGLRVEPHRCKTGEEF